MRVVSVNVGLPRAVLWKGRIVETSIFKEPVRGPVALRGHNLEGDRQVDLSVHGGPTKAVYGYPAEHYGWWRGELPGLDLDWGAFGENLTTEGLLETSLCIGDRLRVGTAELRVTEPRMPCHKLALRLERDDIIERFLASGRSGFYFAVEREGAIAAGDRVEVVERHAAAVPVAEIARLQRDDRPGRDALRRAAALEALPQRWRDRFAARLRSSGDQG
jgi:MOSC domain-containing protein YiiM